MPIGPLVGKHTGFYFEEGLTGLGDLVGIDSLIPASNLHHPSGRLAVRDVLQGDKGLILLSSLAKRQRGWVSQFSPPSTLA